MNRRFSLPLAASIAGHAVIAAALIMLLGRLPSPVPVLVPERAIVVTLAPPTSVQKPAPPKPPAPKIEPPAPPRVEQPPPQKLAPPPKIEQPPKTEQPPKVEKPPPPAPEKTEQRHLNQIERREPPRATKPERRSRFRRERIEQRKPAPAERVERQPPERRAYRRIVPEAAPPRERYAAPFEPAPYRAVPYRPVPYRPPAFERPAAVPRAPAPARPAAPVISAAYRAELSAWLQSHKRYPESARMQGEQGQASLRFRVSRSGRVLSYAIVRSSGYPALDAAVEEMMQGAVLPPFPADMSAPDIEVTVAVRFSLAQ